MRLTLRSMMEAIAIAALILAAFCVRGFTAVAILVLACAAYLVYRQSWEMLARRTARGLTTSRMEKIHILLDSMAVAIFLVGLSDIFYVHL
jgi:hypothetical protein